MISSSVRTSEDYNFNFSQVVVQDFGKNEAQAKMIVDMLHEEFAYEPEASDDPWPELPLFKAVKDYYGDYEIFTRLGKNDLRLENIRQFLRGWHACLKANNAIQYVA